MVGRRNNTKTVIIIILTILVFGLAGFCSYLLFFKEESKTSDCKNVVIDNKKEETDVKYKLEIYGKQYETGAYFICNHKSDTDDCKNVLFSIDTKTPNANIVHISLPEKQSFQYIVYYDDELKLYNVKDNSTKTINIDINGDVLWLYEGFILNGEDESFYYDLKDDEKTIEKYDYIYPIQDHSDGNYINNPKYIQCRKGKIESIIEFKTSNVILSLDSSEYDGINYIKDGSYFIVEYNETEDVKREIYNIKGEKIVTLENNQNYEAQGSKLIIYEYSEKKVKEY